VPALENLGKVLAYLGDEHNSAKYYCRAIIANRINIKSSLLLGMSYSSLDRIEEATEVYRQWLQKEPDNPIAAHFYAACSGHNIPERASNSYIEKTFDGFSSDFDEHLTHNLSYKVPELIGEELATYYIPECNLHTLDAGCGTGLSGAVLSPYARSLTGVDLSSGMLSAAEKLGIYDVLIKEEITEFLSSKLEEYDVIIMADTLIYFGSLKRIFSAVSQALRMRGLFIFSIENSHERAQISDCRLNYNGRYSHTKSYIEYSLRRNGLTPISIAPHALRMEMGCPVDGLLVTAIKDRSQ
jgi:predicted TPR repeat methyltransferase